MKTRAKTVKMHRVTTLRSHKGQALAEYVLVLGVLVFIFLAGHGLLKRALVGYYDKLISLRAGTGGMLP